MRRRHRRVSRLELFYAMVITGLMVGGSLWLDRNGVTPSVAARERRVHRIGALSEAQLTAAVTAMIEQLQTTSMEVWGHAPHSA